MTSDVQKSLVEIRRLTEQLLTLNRQYLEREAEVIRIHREGGRQNYSGDLLTVLNNDLTLRYKSGAAQIVANLITGLSSSIQAEVAYLQLRRAAARNRPQGSDSGDSPDTPEHRRHIRDGDHPSPTAPALASLAQALNGEAPYVCRDPRCPGSCGSPYWDSHDLDDITERWQRIAQHAVNRPGQRVRVPARSATTAEPARRTGTGPHRSDSRGTVEQPASTYEYAGNRRPVPVGQPDHDSSLPAGQPNTRPDANTHR